MARSLPVAGFDAELYLRTVGEEAILGARAGRHRPWDSPLLEPARALVAVGAISAARARAVIEDYSLAEAVRSEHGYRLNYRMAMAHATRTRRAKGKPLKPRRVVPCARTIEDANGAVHVGRVTLSEDSTSLAITWRPDNSGPGRSGRRRRAMMYGPGPGGPLHPRLTDDKGTTTTTAFSGGGSEDEWDGHLTADQPLATDTAWIEIDGHRLELTGKAIECEVSIEPLAGELTAHRYLWRRLATPDFHGPSDIESGIEAVIAAGALEPDDPVLGEVRAVQEAMPDHPGMHGGGAPTRGRRLPEPWASLLKRVGRHDGPEGMLALSALTPEFDGFSVAVGCIESRAEGFGLEVDVAPEIDGPGPGRGLESGELAWWAADDRGNHHLGLVESTSGGASWCSADINFWPALAPKARSLSIMPTARTSRAVIRIPLKWGDADLGGEAVAT